MRPAKRLLLATVVALACLGEVYAEEDPTFGTWMLGQPAPGHLLATHATLLRNNKILVVGGSSYNCCFSWGKEEARLYEIASDTWTAPLASPAPYGSDKDAFCAGHAHDHTGNVIFQGGLLGYWEQNGHGIANSARYDVASGTFTQISGAAAHWYPTLVAGVNHAFNFPGRQTQWSPTPEGDDIHKLAHGSSSWTTTGVSLWTKATYPRVVLLPNGKFFVASPAEADRKNYVFDSRHQHPGARGRRSRTGERAGRGAWR